MRRRADRPADTPAWQTDCFASVSSVESQYVDISIEKQSFKSLRGLKSFFT